MCPKKNFGLKIILDLKKILGLKRNFDENLFGSEKNFRPKKFCVKKNLGLKNVVPTNLLVQKIVGLKQLGPHNLGPKHFVGPKSVWVFLTILEVSVGVLIIGALR